MWQKAGAPAVLKHAQQAAQKILAEHEVPPLAEDQTRALDEIMLAAYARQ
jgi:trimethylamine:corrinoid methyltransferase-like protein